MGSYTEFALTSLGLLNICYTVGIRSWFDPRVLGGMSVPTGFALALLQIVPMGLALAALFRGYGWRWRLPIHLFWIGALILVNSVRF